MLIANRQSEQVHVSTLVCGLMCGYRCMTMALYQAETDISRFLTQLAHQRQRQLKDTGPKEQERHMAELNKWLDDMEQELQREYGSEVR